MFWGYLLCWLPFLLSVLHCTPHTNVNQGYTLYPITYNAVNSCFSLISFVCMRVRACVFAVTTGARSFTNMEKYQAVYVHACIFVWKVACECGYLHRRQKVLCHAAWLAEKKRPQRESLVCFLVTAGWGAPYQAHRLPPGVTLDTSWCVLGRHNTSCQCHKRRGKWVPHHIENYPGSLRSSLKMH